MQKISVAIITRNRSSLLQNCLSELSKQKHKPYEVIVIDNGSIDDTAKVCQIFVKKLDLRYGFERRIGIPFARNKVIELSKGRIIAFIDDDCIPMPDWISRIDDHFSKNTLAVGVVGRIENLNPDNPYSVTEYLYYRRWLSGFIKTNNHLTKLKSSLPIDFKNSAFLTSFIKKYRFSKRAPFGDVGDEDIEFGNRLYKKNRNIFFDPRIVVSHKYSTTLKRLLVRNFWNGYSNKVLKIKFHIETKKESPRSNILELFLQSKNTFTFFNQLILFILLFFYPLFSKLGRVFATVSRNRNPPKRS